MSLLGPEGKKQLKVATRVSAVGLEMVLAICAGYFGGRWLDGRFDSAPYLTYIGLALGLLAAFKALWTVARRTDLDTL
ncbi:MAG: AtpZ/AtpI family protein [Sandaracinaceae bacterium]|nr:AtpZ/AtpI family protein [Sandaracinaceae bacterium]